jgi:hypothetical protein
MGNGFAGGVKMSLPIGITVTSKAAFGSKPLQAGENEVFRYWYVAAMVTGLSLPAVLVIFSGFAGGAYYHMQRVVATMPVDSTFSPSQLNYIPDDKVSLGVRASATFNIASKSVCNGEAGLEVAFNSSGGPANIGLYGKVFILPDNKLISKFTNLKDLQKNLQSGLTRITKKLIGENAVNKFTENAITGKFLNMADDYQTDDDTNVGDDGSISAKIGIGYDFGNSAFDASFTVSVSLVGGIVRGVGVNNVAGSAILHFDPKMWYMYMGTPDNRMGLQIGVGSIRAAITSYLMVGNQLPGSPAPPPNVAGILGISASSLDYMRDLNALSSGGGFAFGSSFSFSTGNLSFLMFYASFDAGFGFDVMLKNYPDAHCEGSSTPIGMNGWYANGQAYAYLQGDIGIRVKLAMIKKSISILKIGAAALFQAKLPNPTWMEGHIGGYFSVLGGLVKGNCSFKVTVGQDCTIVDGGESVLDGLQVISDFTPQDQATGVDVFATPQAVFNMPIGQQFQYTGDDGKTNTYRISLKTFDVTANGKSIDGKLTWNDRNDAATFTSTEILPGTTAVKATVSVSFEQLTGSGWQTVYDGSQAATETKTVNFTTGEAPDNIPLSNIAYCYPVIDQKYCYPKEYNKGYVQLIRGQEYLFNDVAYTHQTQLTVNNATASSTFQYDANAMRVTVDLPALTTGESYTLTLAGIPVAQSSGDNVIQQTQTITQDSTNIEIADNKAAGVITSGKPLDYLTYSFTTSQFNTFKEKMQSKTITKSMYEIIYTNVGALRANVGGSEGFDKTELQGSGYTGGKPLIQPSAMLASDNWYRQTIQQLVYDGYPPSGMTVTNRDTTLVGMPPARAVETLSSYLQLMDNNPNDGQLATQLPYRYNLAYYYYADFRDLQNQVVNRYKEVTNDVPASVRQFFTGVFPPLIKGGYPVLYRYILPGNIQGSSCEFDFDNPLYNINDDTQAGTILSGN